MSITGNTVEYLLGVTERILDGIADKKTLKKYYTLKENVLKKGEYQSQVNVWTL